ncbi:hypothetical protein BDM02DRAFT_3124512 [Thelephora ganbajun]|uniref:Uncharacterized protein n=1 Tax=Thelephora ganbajun TaxID=370292 RepID=A0ACB6YZ61_THEGA|nr:hypothetical protein BDM02DRAFT_3124512 [Thelephora ganbajun]
MTLVDSYQLAVIYNLRRRDAEFPPNHSHCDPPPAHPTFIGKYMLTATIQFTSSMEHGGRFSGGKWAPVAYRVAEARDA